MEGDDAGRGRTKGSIEEIEAKEMIYTGKRAEVTGKEDSLLMGR